MYDVAIIIGVVLLVAAAPIYVFVLAKFAAAGRLSGTRMFMKQCSKGDGNGQE